MHKPQTQMVQMVVYKTDGTPARSKEEAYAVLRSIDTWSRWIESHHLMDEGLAECGGWTVETPMKWVEMLAADIRLHIRGQLGHIEAETSVVVHSTIIT